MSGRNRRLNNAAMALPPASKTTIIQNPPNNTGIAIVSFVAIIVFSWLGWHGLVFLADALGSPKPEQFAAEIIIGSLCLLITYLSAIIIGRAFLSRIFQHRERLADINGQWKYKQLMAQTQQIGNSRMFGDDLRLVKLIEAIMAEAYDHLEDYGQYTKNDAKPWSREQAKKRILPGEREPVGWTLGSQVRGWLQAKGVLRGDIINTVRFPSLGSVQETLRIEFDIPIQVNPPVRWDNRGYDFIDGA